MRIVEATADDRAALTPLLEALWPEYAPEELAGPLAERVFVPDPSGAVFIARSDEGELVAFAEVMLRSDYVNGCESSPVAFLEGVYVDPAWRRRGIARDLADAAVTWGRARGVNEFASDALIENVESHAFHAAIGFAETERVVYFRRPINETLS